MYPQNVTAVYKMVHIFLNSRGMHEYSHKNEGGWSQRGREEGITVILLRTKLPQALHADLCLAITDSDLFLHCPADKVSAWTLLRENSTEVNV